MSQSWTPPPPPLNASAPIPNNMVMAIIATVISLLFCCLPHGAVALIFATQVNKKAEAGDIQGAQNAAKQAKMWSWISIIVSVVWLVVAIVFGVLGAVLGAIQKA
jgi:hypothetical protein